MPNDFSNRSVSTVSAKPMRPIGALPEWAFQEACLGCGDCANVCPKRLIKLDAHRRPIVTSASRCSGCGLCADVCMSGAIEFTPQTRHGLSKVKNTECLL